MHINTRILYSGTKSPSKLINFCCPRTSRQIWSGWVHHSQKNVTHIFVYLPSSEQNLIVAQTVPELSPWKTGASTVMLYWACGPTRKQPQSDANGFCPCFWFLLASLLWITSIIIWRWHYLHGEKHWFCLFSSVYVVYVYKSLCIMSPNTIPAISLFKKMKFFFNLQHRDKLLMWHFVSRALYYPNAANYLFVWIQFTAWRALDICSSFLCDAALTERESFGCREQLCVCVVRQFGSCLFFFTLEMWKRQRMNNKPRYLYLHCIISAP